MDKFEMLLRDLTAKESKQTTTSTQKNSLGSRIGEQREIVVRYAIGREEEAKVYEGTPGKDGPKEDSYAMLYAAGKLIGNATGLDGKEIGDDLVKAATKSMVGNALNRLMKGLEEIL